MKALLQALLIFVAVVLAGSEATNISRFVAGDFPVARSSTDFLLVTFGSSQIVSNDGGLYKFEPSSREILWHRTLRMDLMSVNITEQAASDGYFLPDLNGDFVYVSRNDRIIEVQRQDLEKLLNLCFDQHDKHFLYETSMYYILDLASGQVEQLEDFLKGRQAINHSNVVIRVDRKFLKSIREESQNWNIISSQMHFLTVAEFLSQPKTSTSVKPHPFYNFQRENSHTIQIIDKQSKLSYELESDTSFVDIFSFDGRSFVRHKLDFIKSKHKTKPAKDLAVRSESSLKLLPGKKDEGVPSFEWETCDILGCQTEQPSPPTQLSPLEFCVDSFRVLKETKPKQLAEDTLKEFRVRVAESQPTRQLEISAATLGLILLAGVVFIVVGLRIIQNKILSMSDSLHQTNTELNRKLQSMQTELTNFNEINKHANSIYTIDYATEAVRISDSIDLRQATFLGKKAQVYILTKPADAEIVEVLNRVYNDQPSFVSKVLYLSQSESSWLAFVEPVFITLSKRMQLEAPIPHKTQKHLKEQIVHLTNNLVSAKYHLDCLSPEHIHFDKDNHIKYNPLAPRSELWTAPEQILSVPDPLAPINFMLGCLIYYIYTSGEMLFRHSAEEHPNNTKTNMQQLKRSEKALKALQNDIAFEDLMNKLIPEDRKSDRIPLRQITEHFYFWDASKKLTFINEFSNYLETFVEDEKLRKFEEFCRANSIIHYPWSARLHRQVLSDFCSFRKYDYGSVRDLIRMIRNKTSHFMEVGEAVKEIVGRTKEELCLYFLDRFPKLLCFMFVYTKKKKWKL